MRYRVGIDLLACLPGRMGGHENFIVGVTRSLLLQSNHDYVLFVPDSMREWWQHTLDVEGPYIGCPVSPRRKMQRVVFEHLVLPHLGRKHGLHAFFFPNIVAPWWRRPASVVSVMDLLLLSGSSDYSRARKLYHRLSYDRLARSDAQVVTISEFCKRELSSKLRLPRARLHVASCGLEEEFCRPGHAEYTARGDCPEPYILSVAAAYPHKRLTTLIDTFEQVATQDSRLQLALAGTHAARGAEFSVLQTRVAASLVSDRIHFLPHLAIGDLPGLYARAAAYVSASAFEGFGIPLIEAMAMGCPIAATPAGAVLELVENRGILARDLTADALAEAVRDALRLRRDKPNVLAVAREYVRLRFTWAAAAAAVADAIASAVTGGVDGELQATPQPASSSN